VWTFRTLRAPPPLLLVLVLVLTPVKVVVVVVWALRYSSPVHLLTCLRVSSSACGVG